jgi:hypothetical protein
MGTDGVVDSFPLPEFLIEFGHGSRFFFEEMIELVVVGFMRAFEEAVVLGTMGGGEKVREGVGAGLFKEAKEFGSVVGVEVLEGEGEGVLDLGQEALGGLGGGGGVGAEDAKPGAGIGGGELEDFGAVGEAEVLGIELEEGAGSGLIKVLGGALALSFEAAKVFLPGFGEEEVIAFNEASDGGGGEGDSVLALEEDGEFVFRPGGELFSEGDELVHRGLRQEGRADAAGSAGAVIEGGEIAGVEAVFPLVEGSGGDGKVSAGEAGVVIVGVVEVHPLEPTFGVGREVVLGGEPVKGFGESEETHGDLLWRPQF